MNQLESITDATVLQLIENFVYKELLHSSIEQKDNLITHLYNHMRKLGCIQTLLDDDDISEIMINGYKQILFEKRGMIQQSTVQFESIIEYEQLIQKIVGTMDRKVNEKFPICDVRLIDGSRVNIVLKPIGIDGPYVTIRKFPREKLKKENIINNLTITDEAMEFLELLVKKKYNIFISGGTSSGKTTLLNILSDAINEDERVITIEDSAELKLNNVSNLVRLETRMGDDEYLHHIPIKELIRSALRMRPDRIIVGEVRGDETIDMLQAMNTGHDGSISTGHGNSIKEMLLRLETMVLTGIDIPLPAIRQQIASAIDIMIHIQKISNKGRRIMDISEVIGISDNQIQIQTLYSYDEKEDRIIKSSAKLIHQHKLLWN